MLLKLVAEGCFSAIAASFNSRIDELLPFAPEAIEALLKECG
jgi:hypothetical protein